MKVYLDVLNFSKIYVDYTIYNTQNEKIAENSIQSTSNVIELPTYDNARYVLNYYAENDYGKTDVFTWEFNYSIRALPPKEINVEVQANGTVAYVSWSNCNVEYYTLRVFKGSTYTDLIVQTNNYLYKPSSETETVSFAVACKSPDLLSYTTQAVTVSKIPSTQGISNPPQPTVGVNSYEYVHSPLSVLLRLDVTHGNRDDVVGTVVMVTNTPANPKWITQTIYKNFNQATFQIPWIGTNNMQIQIKAYSFSSTGLLSNMITVDYTIPRFTQTIQAPILNVLVAGFDSAYCSWTIPTATGQLKYDLQYSEDSSFNNATTITTITNSYTVQFNYSTDKTIYFRVKAYDDWGNTSNFSSIVSASIVSKQDFQSSLNQTLTNTQNQINNLNNTAKMLEGDMFTNFINSAFSDSEGNPSLHGWNIFSGTGSVVSVSDGIGGKYAIQNNSNSVLWIHSNKLPIDSNKTYRVEAYARTISGTSGVFYLAVVLFDANGSMITVGDAWWYYPAAGVVPPAQWTQYSGEFGYGTSKPFPSNAKYMAVGLILNYNSGSGNNRIMQVQLPRIIHMYDSVYIRELHGNKIAANSITGNKIVANSIGANHIASGSITADKLSVTNLSAISSNIGEITAGKLSDSTTNNFIVDLNNQQIKISHPSNSQNPYFLIGSNIVSEGGVSKTGILLDGSKLPSGINKIAKFKEIVLEATTVLSGLINVGNTAIDSINGLTVKDNNNNTIFKANSSGVEIGNLNIPNNSLDGAKILDYSIYATKHKKYNLSVSAMIPISFTPSVSSSSLVSTNSNTLYGRYDGSYLFGGQYYNTASYKSFSSDIQLNSLTCTLSNQKIRIALELSDVSPSTRTVGESTEGVLKRYVSSTSIDDLWTIYNFGETVGTALLYSGDTLSRVETDFFSAEVQFTLSNFTSTKYYQFNLPSRVWIYHNGSWRTGNVSVTGATSYMFKISAVSLSYTINIACVESSTLNFEQLHAPIVGGIFMRNQNISTNNFSSYLPSNSTGWSRGTINSYDQTGWSPQINMPLHVLFSHEAPGTQTIAWWWDFYESVERNVKIELQIVYNDDAVAVFTTSDGINWTKQWERTSYTPSWNRVLLSYSNVRSLVIMVNNNTGRHSLECLISYSLI